MVRGHSVHETSMAPRSRGKKAAGGKPAATSSARGRLVQAKAGRARRTRDTRPASRDPAQKAASRTAGGLRRSSRPQRNGSRGRQPSDRAGSGQGGRKN